MNFKNLFFTSCLLLGSFSLSSCKPNTFEITFDSNGGSLVPSQIVEEGKKIKKPENPIKEGYTFDGWYYLDELWSFIGYIVENDMTLTAHWDINKYTVTWLNYDDSILEVDNEVPYGSMPTYDGEMPLKEGDAQYSYSFYGWDKDVEPVSESITYKAIFKQNINKYTVRWQNYDGTLLEEDKDVLYGETPSFDGDNPKRESDAQYHYSFMDWSPKIAIVEGNVTYTATYETELRKYNVSWVNYDDSLLEKDLNVDYGTMPTYDGQEPVKESDAQYTYAFDGWDKEVSLVTSDVTYKAKFKETINVYTITWINYDDTILFIDTEVAYGTMPFYHGATPVKPKDAQYTYVFDGWDKKLEPIKGDVTYKAVFKEIVNTYKITWLDYYDNILEVDNEVPYGTMPTYDGETPIKEGNAQYSYLFSGWDHEIVSVTGDATYKATFTLIVNTYIVTWKNYDGTVLEIDNDVCYGSIPTYDGEVPIKNSERLSFKFNGWSPEISMVDKNITYTASFDLLTNKIELGSYPQKVVTNKAIIDQLDNLVGGTPLTNKEGWTNYNEYYVNSNDDNQSFRWFKDIEFNSLKYRAVYLSKTPSYCCEYEADQIYYFQFLPIKWNVLNNSGLVLADMILDSGQNFYNDFNERQVDNDIITPNNYQNSNVKKWLNTSFINNAFNNNEIQNDILASSLDRVFLLDLDSFNEDNSYINSRLFRQIMYTDYAACMGVSSQTNSAYANWWLRTPSPDYENATFVVDDEGHINYYFDVNDFDVGICPALMLAL